MTPPDPTTENLPTTTVRVRALDWMRGLVMVLMTVDHASGVFNAGRFMRDAVWRWQPGTEIPAAQFLVRWMTHLCAPTFVALAGAAVALSFARRAADPAAARAFDRHLFLRGALIWAIDPAWMSLAFTGGKPLFQVMYALGASFMALALLRRLSPRVLFTLASAILLGGEAAANALAGTALADLSVTKLLLTGGMAGPIIAAYPLLPWLAIMLLGYVAGTWVARGLPWTRRGALLGVAMLLAFAVLRGLNAYGNGNLLRDSAELVQWLHVAKYPPSLTFVLLEGGLMLVCLAALAFTAVRAPIAQWVLRPLELLGRTALFYYVLHAHLMGAFALLTDTRRAFGIDGALLGAIACLLLLYPACIAYDRYKRAHPDGWTRFL